MEISIFTEQREIIRSAFPSDNFDNLVIATALPSDGEFIKFLESERILYVEREINGSICCIAYRNLDFTQSRKPSEGSKAIYLAERKEGNGGLLLQYLPPKSETSRHYHELTTERFHNLEGRCFIDIGETKEVLEQSSCTVPPWRIHQVRTKELPALTVLEINGNPRGLSDMSDHYHLKFNLNHSSS